MTWKEFLKKHKLPFIILAITFIVTLVVIYFFLIYVEKRKGVSLNDPFLAMIPAINVSVPLFILTYSGTLFGVIYAIRKPELAILTAVTYMLVLWFRMICMYFTPLEPPVNIIPLRDFLLESTFYSGNVNLKDLFFSGHTASMFLFFMVTPNKKMKWVYGVVTFLVASLVLIQHAHYTIDILVAPVMVWLAYEISKKIRNSFFI